MLSTPCLTISPAAGPAVHVLAVTAALDVVLVDRYLHRLEESIGTCHYRWWDGACDLVELSDVDEALLLVEATIRDARYAANLAACA